MKTTPGGDALWGARNARVTLLAGFTTCRDMGPAWPYVDVDLRNAIDEGAVPGPRLMVAGNYVSSTGGAGDARQFSIYVDVPLVRNLADGPDEVTKAVRTNFKNGADFIKILATGAMLSKGISPGAQQYSDEEIQAAVVEARALGHARWRRTRMAPTASKRRSAPACAPSITARPRRRGDRPAQGLQPQAFYVPTLYTYAAIDRAGEQPVPERERERARQMRSTGFAGFRRALAAGLPIGFAHRRRGDPARREREGVRRAREARRVTDGRPRRRHLAQRRDPGVAGSRRLAGAGQVRRHHRGARRSAARHHRAGARRLRHEGRRHHRDELARRH